MVLAAIVIMEVLKQLLGRLHPLIVHLPIGCILLGLLLQWVGRKGNKHAEVLPFIYLCGAITALTACFTGYLQYVAEGFAFETVKWHLWLGILTTLIAFAMYLKVKLPRGSKQFQWLRMSFLSLLLLVAVFMTGHQGGTITHGEDYLLEPLPNAFKKRLGITVYEPEIIELSEADWQKAPLYDSVIRPILNNYCATCHNSKKEKGGLLLISPEGILAGGDNGKVIKGKDPGQSPLYRRITLPEDHDDHMPPKGKLQPGKEEVALIREWIIRGSSFDKSIGDLALDKTLFESFFPKTAGRTYPETTINAVPDATLAVLKTKGIHVQRMSSSTNYMSVSCLNYPQFEDADMALLLPVAPQIASLDLGGTQVTDSIWKGLASFPNLTTLKMDHTAITGKGLIYLNRLGHLRVLNLTGTSFDRDFLKDLLTFPQLEAGYLYHTGLTEEDFPDELRPDMTHLQFGNYELPALPSDSITY